MTRVGLSNSSLAESEGSGGGGSEGEYCSRGKKAQFEIVVAFDAAPPSPDGAEAASLEAAEGEESEEGEGEEAAGSESGSAEASTSTSTGAAG